MKPKESLIRSHANSRRPRGRRFIPFIAFAILALPSRAHASLFHGETLDSIANGISWFVLFIAHKKKHPQTKAIQCLCLLSLCFGGLLWPLAWLWAYSKPVLHKLAYGTDVDETVGHHGSAKEEEIEIEKLRARVAELEAQARGGKA